MKGSVPLKNRRRVPLFVLFRVVTTYQTPVIMKRNGDGYDAQVNYQDAE